MSLETYSNAIDSSPPRNRLNKCENSEVIQIWMLTNKSISVRGYILTDFDAKSFQYKSNGYDGRVKSWILAGWDDGTADVWRIKMVS